MKTVFLLTISWMSGLLAHSSFAADANVETMASSVDAKVLAWRRDIHQFPELGNREFRTSKQVTDPFKKLGLKVQTGIAHTGVVAILKGDKPGPRIAIRADMDALPVTERNVVDMPLVMGAEDFSYYAKEVPGFFFFVGVTPQGQDASTAASNHSPEFFLDESALKVGTRSLLQVTLDYLNKAP